MVSLKIPGKLLSLCFEHGRECYPEEACGVLSGPESDGGALTEAHRLPNVLNQLHGEDPQRYPRTAREGYVMDPQAHLRLERRLRAEGRSVKVLYHSHADVGAYFSAEDRQRALWDGQPLYPGTAYLVCGIKQGQPDGAILAWYDEAARDWQVAPVES
jgi:proteasome lid subunit RPN8/RPN11